MWGGTFYELAPGEETRYHWQVGEEEWLLVVAGTPTLRTPEGEQVLKPWDVAAFRRGAQAGRAPVAQQQVASRCAQSSSRPSPIPRSSSIWTRAGPRVVAGMDARRTERCLRGWVVEP